MTHSRGSWLKRVVVCLVALLAGVPVGAFLFHLCALHIGGFYSYGGMPQAWWAHTEYHDGMMQLVYAIAEAPDKDWRSFRGYAEDLRARGYTVARDAPNPFPNVLRKGKRYDRLDVFPEGVERGLVPLLWSTDPFPGGRPYEGPDNAVWVLCLDGSLRKESLADVRERVEAIKSGRHPGLWQGVRDSTELLSLEPLSFEEGTRGGGDEGQQE